MTTNSKTFKIIALCVVIAALSAALVVARSISGWSLSVAIVEVVFPGAFVFSGIALYEEISSFKRMSN